MKHVLIAALLVVSVACSKERRLTKDLTGSWELVAKDDPGFTPQRGASIGYTLVLQEDGKGHHLSTPTSLSYDITWEVRDDSLFYQQVGANHIGAWFIAEHKKNNLVLRSGDGIGLIYYYE